MTDKEKAKAYDNALAWMRSVYPTLTGAAKEDAEHYFPELKESEDEKIRKAILELVKQSSHILNPMNQKSMIAWLERQGEHANFRNKIQIGDEVTRNEDGMLVNLSQLDRVAKKRVKQGEKKSSWREKDNGMVVLVAKILDNHKSDADFVLYNTPYENVVSWLKSLKERMKGENE